MAETSRFINRELSWLEFNQRVLDEAKNESVPLLERLKFLAITGSNLDEFFMVRVGGLMMLRDEGRTKPDPAGMTPEQQLEAISQRTHRLVTDQYACLLEQLLPALAEAGVQRLQIEELHERQLRLLEEVMSTEIAPILSPQAVADQELFPLLAGRQLHLAVRLAGEGDEPRMAVIPCRVVPRFLTLQSDRGYSFILLEDALRHLIDRFFIGEEVLECIPFRITRNADMAIREDQAADLLAGMEQLLARRKEGDCVRLEIDARASDTMLSFLASKLEVDPAFIFRLPGPIDLASWMQVAGVSGFESLKYEDWPPLPSPEVPANVSIFETIRQRDFVLYHPYEQFEPVVRLVEEAADDPDVLAIKQTLYRTSRNSPIIAALARAAEKGKYVTAVIELKARFDEARNIEWARELEKSNVQVIYGVKGLKTHAKICMVIRREADGIHRYLHFGTGNYNESTARLYSDVSFFTTHELLGADATNFFNAVTGYSEPQVFHKLDMAPLTLRDRLLELIEFETDRKRQGQEAAINAKLNSLVDPEIIEALYEASQAGVPIRLNIRGICCLRPGVPGLSDQIEVVGIIDRYLEHARILHFHHGGAHRVFISSADWMPRNLDRRVELLVPVEDERCKQRLLQILDVHMRDTVKGRRLLADGSYARPLADTDPSIKPLRSQEWLYRRAVEAVREAEHSRRNLFEPHLGGQGAEQV